MPDGLQLSLLDWLDAQQPAGAPYVPLSRSEEWDRFIAGSLALTRQRIHVSAHWTGIVAERLIDHGLGHWLLWANGVRVEYGPSPRPGKDQPLRLIHMTADATRDLHRRHPLVQDRIEPSYSWFRFAEPGELSSTELRMPTP